MSLTGKMLVAFLTIGLIPLVILFYVVRNSIISNTEKDMGGFYEIVAEVIMEKMDGIVAEGYSDVQAYVTNGDIQDQSSWYSKDPTSNKVTQVMDTLISI